MWPFDKKFDLEKSQLLKGFTDWHSHILPGVDDGVAKMEESVAILAEYERQGVTDVWLTPHVMEDIPNTPEELKERFAELQQAYTGSVRLHLAAENMLDSLFDERIAKGEVLPIGEEGNHLLVETSYFTPPFDMDDKLQRVRSAGFFPVLAHPERYVYMDTSNYDRLHDEGVKFQLNVYSMFGMYGPQAREKAKYILKKGYYNIKGTDTHRFAQLQRALRTSAVTAKEVAQIADLNSL